MKLGKEWFAGEYHLIGTDREAIWKIFCPFLRSPVRRSQWTKIWLSSYVESGAFIFRNGVLAIFPFAKVRETVLLVDSLLRSFHGWRRTKSIWLHGTSESSGRSRV